MDRSHAPHSSTRRRFLRAAALTGAGVLTGVGGARAWTTQPMDVAAHRLYADRCRQASDGYHQQLAADLRARLAGQESEASIEQALAALRCPICGCAVVAQAG